MSDGQNSNQTEFYVSKGDQTLGPWTMDEIADRLARAEISVTDFVYDESRTDWIPLLECAALKERLRRSKPKAPPPQHTGNKSTPTKGSAEPARNRISTDDLLIGAMTAETSPTTSTGKGDRVENEALARAFTGQAEEVPTETPSQMAAEAASAEWFVQKGNHRYGPFSYMGLVKALQEKSIYEFDFVWKSGMERWVRLAEHEDFRAEKIRGLRDKVKESSGVFFHRRHPRIPFDSEVIVHDNRSVWMGRAYEGSVGGSGLVIENATLVPGQVILLHFAAREGLPAFNALCEIVSKKYVKEIRDPKAPVSYSVRFLKMDAGAEPAVQEYFRTRAPNEVGATRKMAA